MILGEHEREHLPIQTSNQCFFFFVQILEPKKNNKWKENKIDARILKCNLLPSVCSYHKSFSMQMERVFSLIVFSQSCRSLNQSCLFFTWINHWKCIERFSPSELDSFPLTVFSGIQTFDYIMLWANAARHCNCLLFWIVMSQTAAECSKNSEQHILNIGKSCTTSTCHAPFT